MSWLSRKFNKVAPAPKIHQGNVKDIFHGQTVRDPYRHLENLDDKTTLKWAHAHTDRFQDFVSDFSRRQKMTNFLKDVINYPKESIPARHGDKWFKSYNSGLEQQAKLMVADDINGPWETLFDPNTLSKDGTVALNGKNIRKDGKKMIYLLSEAGSDERTLYVMDVETGKTQKQDTIEGCRFTSTSWDEDGKGFIYNYPANDGKKNMILKHHTLGENPSNDEVLFRPGPDKEHAGSWIFRAEKKEKYDWLTEDGSAYGVNGLSFRQRGDVQGNGGPFTKLFEDGKAAYSVIHEMDDGKILMRTDDGAPNGKVVLFDPYNPESQNWQTVVPENKEDSLVAVFEHKGKLYAVYSHDTADQIKIYDLDGAPEGEIPLPPQSSIGLGHVNDEDDHFLIKVSGFQTPGTVYKYDLKTGAFDLFKKSAGKAGLSDAIVERIHATSKDGTKVPMTVIRSKDTKLDGTAATRLYGYGGFNVSLEPGFSNEVMNWVREGGVYVQANLRGGGEYGRDWYDQGRLENKQNVFDDFIACAEHLIKENYTSKRRLVIEGGSNGGLLTAATMLQRPDLFGAVISDVPVTDMLRFHKFTYGAFWKSDYGDPENSQRDFKVSMGYSPYHNVQKNKKYPPILVQTADHDDRVVPSHSYKLVAMLQNRASNDNLVLLNVEKDAGHGAGKPLSKIVAGMVDTFAFVEKSIGPVNQISYKMALKAAARRNNRQGPKLSP